MKIIEIHRSPEWPRVERAHLLKQPHCVCCKPGTNTAHETRDEKPPSR